MQPAADVPTIAYWSPLPPQPSGVADYSAELLEHLAEHARIDAYVDDSVTPAGGLPPGVTVWPAVDYERRRPAAGYAASVYHMGNHSGFHSGIYQRLLREPGLTVLHDLYLGTFYRGLFQGRPNAFLDEVAYNYGFDTRAMMEARFARGALADDFELDLTRRTVEASLAVIVHSEWARQTLQKRYPHKPILFIPQGAAVVRGASQAWRQRHNLAPDQLLFGVFTGMGRIKRLHVVIEAFRRFYLTCPSARLVLVGRADDPPYLQELQVAIRTANLRKAVIFAGEIALADFMEAMLACDVVVNLRWPTAGETSASMMRAFGAGKVVIASDVPQFREFPESFCWRVPVDGEAEIPQIVNCFTQAAQQLAQTRAAGEQARQFVEQHHAWDKVAQHLALAIQAAPGWRAQWVPAPPPRAAGVNLVGDLRLDAGLGEAAVGVLKTLVKRGVPVSHSELTYRMAQRTAEPAPALISALPRGALYPVNLLTLNVHEVTAQPPERLRAVLGGRYTIAHWFWELPQIPPHFAPAFAYVDEIWVPSAHTQASMQAVFRGPVHVIPVPVEVTTSPQVDRARFGLPHDRYIFLFSFSATSCHARKNPFGLIEAFQKAFGQPDGAGPLLVLRAHHLDKYAELQTALHHAAGQVGAILLEEPYTRQQMNDLLACADAHVSLHRAEGFGLSLAESAYLGKPVIATGYSGNADWMTPANSYLVDYRLRPITADDHCYQPACAGTYLPGQLWAEPDLEQAAGLMRHVYENQAEARERGRQAALDIRRHCSPEVVGQRMEERLVAIELCTPRGAAVQAGAAHVDLMTGRSGPANELLAFYRQALREWLTAQAADDYLPFGSVPGLGRLVRLPGVRRAVRLARRLRRLSFLTSKQMALHSAAHETAEVLAAALEDARAETAALREAVARLEAEVAGSRLSAPAAALSAAEEQVRHLTTELQAVEHLPAQLATAQGQVRLLTSQLRWLEQALEAATTADQPLPLTARQFIALIETLEGRFPALAQAGNVHVSVQAVTAEEHILLAANHFGPRLNARQWRLPTFHESEAWYHIDFSPDWNRPALFENARAMLVPEGLLVLVTSAEESGAVPAVAANGLRLIFDGEPAGEPGRVRVRVWQPAA